MYPTTTHFCLLRTDSAVDRAVDGITIDAPTSMDLDDAVWLEDSEGGVQVTISIADVARKVLRDSPLDLQAKERGFTRYFARGSAPMLPPDLSEDRLSLLPGKPRRVVCVRITLDDALAPTDVAVFAARLKSAARLNHADIRSILRGDPEQETYARLRPMLERMAALAGRLLHSRRNRGELALYDLHSGWTLSEEGVLHRLRREERHIGYIVVQELMILANRSVAELLVQADVPTLYRNHVAREAAPDRASLLADIQAAISHPDTYDLETLERRMQLLLSRARYGPDLHGHFGLNLPAYLHFTSPIRRYADLVNHCVLKALLEGMPSPYARADLVEIGEHLNSLVDREMERSALAHKRRAEARAAELVVADPERIARLPEKQVFQVLEASIAHGPPPDGLVEGMEMRLASETASLKELYFMLFESPRESEEWARLRGIAWDWLASRQFHAVSLIFIGSQAGDWTAPSYDYAEEPGRFRSTVSVTRGAERLDSGARAASNKKTAQQRAALALCSRLLGTSLPSSFECAGMPSVSNEISLPVQKVSRAEQRQLTALQRVEDATASEDWVSALWDLLAAHSVRRPGVINRPVHDAGATSIRCTMKMAWAGQPLEAEATAPTARRAKHLAARALLDRIQNLKSETVRLE